MKVTKILEDLFNLGYKFGIKIDEVTLPTRLYKELEKVKPIIPKASAKEVPISKSAFSSIRINMGS